MRYRVVMGFILVLFTLALVSSAPAAERTAPDSEIGGFTAAEIASLQWFKRGLLQMNNSTIKLTFAVRNMTTPEATRDGLGTAYGHATTALWGYNRAWSILNGANVEDIPGGGPLSRMTRAGRVAAAWAEIDRAAGFVEQAKTALKVQSSTEVRDAVGQFHWAVDNFRGVDRTLAYARPLPAIAIAKDGKPHSVPTVISGHGVYTAVQDEAWLKVHYLARSMQALADGIRVDAPLPTYEHFFRAMNLGPIMLLAVNDTQMRVAGITTAPENDRFFSTMHAFANLTAWMHNGPGIPRQLHTMNVAILSMMPYTPTRPNLLHALTNASIQLTDAWSHADQLAWEMLIFPDCKNPGGCGGR